MTDLDLDDNEFLLRLVFKPPLILKSSLKIHSPALFVNFVTKNFRCFFGAH